MSEQQAYQRVTYRELAALFLRLSVTAFGGPLAHIALAEDEVVARRKWLTREHFMDIVAATNLIPGPNSTEVMIHIGYLMRGVPGAVLAGACFITPAFLLTLALAMLYASTGTLPQAAGLLAGIQAVMIAIIAQVTWRFAPGVLKTRGTALLAALCLLALLAGKTGVTTALGLPAWLTSELTVMLAAGTLYALRAAPPRLPGVGAAALLPLLTSAPLADALPYFARAGVWEVFLYFLRIGAVLFGSGYLLVAYIQQDLVNAFGWLTTRELLDAVAIGQMTPGPVLTTVAVVGYLVAGVPGAALGTLGVFLPAFLLVIFAAPLLPKMRASRFWGAFLAGVNAGVLAAIVVTLAELGAAALRAPDGSLRVVSVLLAGGALVVLLRTKVNATWLIAAGALAGLLLL